MTDIVERLRSENTLTGYYDPPQLQADAADEIERLRAALMRCVQYENKCDGTGKPCDAARCGCALEAEGWCLD